MFLARPSHGLVKVMSWVSSMPSAVKTAGRTLKFPKLIAAEPEK